MVCLKCLGTIKKPEMKGKKDKLAKWLHRTGLLRLLNFGCGKYCMVINYHRIRECAHHETIFDDEVFGPDQYEFQQQVDWLTKNSDILSEKDLISVVQGEYQPPGRSAIITFDDGYIDNYTLAYPVLKQYHAPAIFFIPTKSIEKRHLGWWDCFAYLLKTTKKKEVVFEGKRLQPKEQLQEAMHFVLHFIDQSTQGVSVVMDRLRAACEVDFPARAEQDKELMTWEHLKEVSSNGISVGAHSHSHKVLSSLDLEQQKYEVKHSKAIIEQRIGKTVRSMSYPVGNYHHFSEDTKKIAADVGYELAFSFLTGLNTYGAIDPMDIKRVSASSYFPRFVGEMELPRLFCDSV